MRLKSLKMCGFKSFGDQTELNFKNNSITLIVGPNGCGKSNVVDAIRWVLGEQSPRYMRSSSMEDVIFNGSEVRKPVGRSEVTINFDNSNGGSPEKYRDLTEISVTRRLYRSGESEYLINKTPCRLMDIRELVMDTGAAGRSYSIVEQGRVEEFITSSPTERRIYMEEAAGIVRYKTKRIAAEKKIENTRNNLLRVADLLGELHRQEITLRDQKEKAKEYYECKEKAELLNARLARGKYLKSVALCREMKHSQALLAEGGDDLNKELAAQQAKLSSQTLELSQREALVQTQREELHTLEKEIQNTESRLALEKQNQENTREWIGKINQSLADHIHQKESLSEDISAVRKELEDLQGQDDALGKEVAGIEAELAVREKAQKGIEGEMESAQENMLECHTRLTGISNQRQFLTERLEEGTRQISGLETQKAGVLEGEETLNRKLAEVRSNLLNRRNDQRETEESITRLSEEISATAIKADQVRAKLSLAEKETLENRLKLNSLQEIESGREDFDEKVRAVLEWAEQNQQACQEIGWLGPLADFIKVKPEKAAGVADFLAAFLETIVIREAANLPLLQQKLEAEKLGGVRLVALDAYQEIGNIGNNSGGSPESLSDLLDFPDEFQQLKQGLFSAIKIHPEGTLPYPLPETGAPAGGQPSEWLAADGRFHIDHRRMVSLGGSAVPAAGILRRRAEISGLEEKLVALEARLEKIEKEARQHAVEADARERQLSNQTEQRTQFTLDINQLEHEQDLCNRESERLNQVMEGLEESESRLAEEAERFSSQQSELERDGEECNREREEMEEQLALLQEQTAAAAGEASDTYQQLTTKKIERQKIISCREYAANRLEELSLQEKGLAEKSVETEENLRRQESSRKSTEQAIETITDALSEGERNYAASQQTLKEAREDYDRQETTQQELSRQVAGKKQQAENHQTKHHQAELNLTAELARMERWAEQLGADLPEQENQEEFSGQNLEIEEFDEKEVEKNLITTQRKLESMEGVNLAAPDEYQALTERLEFLDGQKSDLETAISDLEESIRRMNKESRRRFKETFDKVNGKFQEIFPLIFNGGKANLILTNSEDLLLAGVDIEAQPPGKNLQNLNLLSGGEKALTAIALIFSFFLIKPSPFCLLDEVDAPLDDINVGRFVQLIQNMTDQSQFIIITHNKRTMEIGDVLYGVTMEEAGVSKIVSVDLSA